MTSERYGGTFEMVKRAVDALDPMGLLDMGAPSDEYDLESKLIVDRLSANMSPQQIAWIMAEEFSSCFGERFSADDFLSAAETVKAPLNADAEDDL